MKFGKEFSFQMVPEWQAAYVDYNKLKGILKEILHFKRERVPVGQPSPTGVGLKRRMTMYRAFSGLTRMYSGKGKQQQRRGREDLGEEQVILVNAVEEDDDKEDEEEKGRRYETMFLMSSDEGGEYEVVFFKRLDEELNKVNQFYKAKAEEVMEEAHSLTKQMDALIAFRLKVENPKHHTTSTTSTSASASASAPPSASAPITPATEKETSSMAHMDAIQEVELNSEECVADDWSEENERKAKAKANANGTESGSDGGAAAGNNKSKEKMKKGGPLSRPAPLDILEHVKINVHLETPRSTLKGMLRESNHKDLSFNTVELKKAEEQLKRAFVEFYRKLRLLKNYSFLNLLAFSKIMKKYDKITSRNASRTYLRMVDNSYLGSSDEVTKLLQRVEDTFVKHFSNSNRRKGMNALRPGTKKEKHRITFSLGFFAGCSISLMVALILIARARNIYDQKGSTLYMNTMFPLYSLYGFIVLHMLIYAANIYFWRRYCINFSFIFGLKQGREMGYREVFLLSTTLSVLALAGVLANLDMEMDKKTKDYKMITELVPLGLATLVILVILCPFNIIYRSSRLLLLQSAFHCICAPLYKVTLPDFFLADQLTSQVQAIRSLEFYICYYGWGDFKRRQNKCFDYSTYKTFYFIVAIIPYWARFLQCIRRTLEEKDMMQGYNGLKYLATIVAVTMRTSFELRRTMSWRVMAGITSAIAAVVSTYWDLVIDWGLLRRESKNRWLRDKLLVPHKSVYFAAIVLNILLRFAWLQSIFGFQVNLMHKNALAMIVACLEIVRRGIWNFFRLENEHLNNVGKYRAFKSVPLPFNYDEEEDKAE